jgi:hypothetical protein
MKIKYIKTIVGIIYLLLLIYLLSGCGVNYHAKRASHHIQKAKMKGLDISVDTTYVEVPITIPGDSIKVNVPYKVTDTVTINKEQMRIVYYPTPEGLGVECYCFPQDTLIFNPVVTKTFPVEIVPDWVKKLKWALIIITVVGVIFLLKKVLE